MSENRVAVGDIELNVFDAGAGPPLLFVHGFPLDHTMWDAQIKELQSHFRVIAPDLRGFGQSSTRFGKPDLTILMEEYAEGERAVFKRRTAYSLGFMKPSTDFAFGSSPAAFGAPGVGGSFGFADPGTRSGYAYVTNRLGFNVFDDPREQRLRYACKAALERA